MIIVQILLVASLLCGATAEWQNSKPDPLTCSVKDCPNTCEAQGKSCCYCDTTKTYGLPSCFCCPKNYTCCPNTQWGMNAQCCPDGYECLSDGTCSGSLNVPVTEARGTSAMKCRNNCTVYVTVDDSFTMYIDGQQQTLQNANNWTIADIVNIPGNARLITLCSRNELYKAGILIYSPNCPYVIDNAQWRCTPSTDKCPGWWTDNRCVDTDPNVWSPPVPDECNDGKGTRKSIVSGISTSTSYMWCNKGIDEHTKNWEKYCTCRIWLPGGNYTN